jgi:6-phospho-beta-glucosidase
MALRSIPAMLEYVRLAERRAPRAWLLNFTNPVGIVSQALLAAGARRVIGVCDTPREMFEAVARQLALESRNCFFDYFGLNHLGWLRRVLIGGEDQLPRLLAEPEHLAAVYHVPLFDSAFLVKLRMLPTEYVYFYLNAAEAVAKLKQAGSTRGEMVREQERMLFQTLAGEGSDAKILAAYDNYLTARNATYFALETGARVGEEELEHARRDLYEKAAGYERIAVDVIRAIAGHMPAMFPVNVANNGSIDGLSPEDAVEVPCVIDGNGARPLAVGEVPASVRSLFFQVKEYERLTAQAALGGSAALAEKALAANPLVNDKAKAGELARAYRQAHRHWLDYLA